MRREVPRSLLFASAIAFGLTLAYAVLVQPGWEPQLTDQQQYLSLARGIVERNEFTRATRNEGFIPETYRLPGYPLVIASTCVGGCDHWRIAVLQAALFVVLVFAIYGIARRVVPRAAGLAAILTACYLPFAYYGALALSDLAGAAIVAIGILAWIRALDARSARWAVAAGALFGWAALIRGALLLLPVVLAAMGVFADRRAIRAAVAALAAAAIVVAPYVIYSEFEYARPVGGTSGLVLWLGVFQGRTEASLDAVEQASVAASRADIAAFDGIDDRVTRARAWLTLDDTLGARARSLIARDPTPWLLRAIPRTLVLWGGDTPIPGGAVGELAALLASVQLLLVAAGCGGAAMLWRRDRHVGSIALSVIAYVWLTAVPFQTEARYALPARAFVLLGVAAVLDAVVLRRARSRSVTPDRRALP